MSVNVLDFALIVCLIFFKETNTLKMLFFLLRMQINNKAANSFLDGQAVFLT